MPVKIYNSLAGKIEEQAVCAEGLMKFLYGSNPAGSLALWALFRRAFFSKICGVWAKSKTSKKYALKFIEKNNIDVSEMFKKPEEFSCFNDFFTRELKFGARPVSQDPLDISFPADGRHLAFENLSAKNSFYIKNREFKLAEFLGSESLAKRFEQGAMMISRLSPADYHRFHWGVSGIVAARKKIGGSLYSVSPIALRKNLDYLLQNKRVLTLVELGGGAMCATVEIGATNVGSIVELDNLGDAVSRGECRGYFNFGGSCIVTIFEKGSVKFNADILKYSAEPVEYYALANQTCGKLLK